MQERTRRWALGIAGAALVSTAAMAAPAAASDVALDSFRLEIQGDPDTDVITLSTNGTTFTITDTGAGGVNTTDGECIEVNPTTVTCTPLPGDDVRGFSANLDDGVDTFTNQNFISEFGDVGGFDGAKTINGGPGSQFLFGGIDNDVLDGGPGEDGLFDGSGEGESGTAGNDVLIGGEGIDQTEYFRQDGVAVTITLDGIANDGQAGEADNVQVENVITGLGNDIVVGDAGPNLLSGSAGNDLVRGGGGNDELLGDEFGRGLLPIRGIAFPVGNDTLEGGPGRDSLDCGRGFDVALREPADDVDTNCERIGAEVVGDNAAVSKKNKFKVLLECPASEGEACAGKLKITSSGKKVGKGKFSVAADKTKGGKAKLSKKGAKKLRRAGGSLMVTAIAKTTEPGGVAVDTGRILIQR
jgi:Ca2+-binding RTX toxin-like protein